MNAPAASLPQRRRWPQLSLSTQILIGLALGLALGVAMGEEAALLQPLADIYIRLVQMTVLPYLVLTLVVALGALDAAGARRLARAGGALLLLFWALTLATLALLPLALPVLESASFFSNALTEPRQALSLIETYVPANPFNALANTVVPAVVLFSLAVGIALIGVPGRGPLLDALRVLEQAIVRVTQFVIRTTPLGVLAIAAVAAGTLDLATLQRLQAYFILFAVGALLLTFVVLPLVVTALTPLSYRDAVGVAGPALLTAFVANSVFIVLPILIERMRELLRQRELASPTADATIEVLVPLAFVFPNAGRLLTLLFVPYVAWLNGTPLTGGDTATLFGAGLFAHFAKAQVALPFLLDLVGLPHDYFNLYIPTTILTGKFDSMVSAAALTAFGLTAAVAASHGLRWAPRRVLAAAVAMVLAAAAALFGTRVLLAATVDTTFRTGDALETMHAPRGPLPVVVLDQPPPPATGAGSAFERIRARGALRVGYVIDRPPFSFRNRDGALVGMDVELAGALARDLGVAQLEFYGAPWAELVALLAADRIDVIMSLPYLHRLLAQLHYSRPYLDGIIGFAVPDAQRHDFATAAAMRRRGLLVLGIATEDAAVRDKLRAALPGVDLGFVTIGAPRDFFRGRHPEVDAMAMLAQEAAALSLLHPQYSVVVPQPHPPAVPVGIAMRSGHSELAAFIDNWLELQRSSGALRRAHDYWVLGQGANPPRRRWSVWHDVLHWPVLRGIDAATPGSP